MPCPSLSETRKLKGEKLDRTQNITEVLVIIRFIIHNLIYFLF